MVEAKDVIIPLVLIGGLILLGRRRAEEAPPEEKPPIPEPPIPQLPILAPPPEEVEKARREAEMYRAEAERLWAEAERLRVEAERLRAEAEARLEKAFREAEETSKRAREIIERIQRVIEERRREAEEFQPTPTIVEYPTVEIPEIITPRIPIPPGIRLSNSNLVVEDPQYVGRFITACVTWFCTNFRVLSVPHREPIEPRALRYARETGNRIVIYVDGSYWGEIPV